jgi:hypothetical protein
VPEEMQEEIISIAHTMNVPIGEYLYMDRSPPSPPFFVELNDFLVISLDNFMRKFRRSVSQNLQSQSFAAESAIQLGADIHQPRRKYVL